MVQSPGPLNGLRSTHRVSGVRVPLGHGAAAIPPLAPPPSPTFTPRELADGEAELTLLAQVYGVMKASNASVVYVRPAPKGGPAPYIYDTASYLTDRNAFFGSASTYATYLADSKARLDANGAALRGQVDPPRNQRVKKQWPDAQDVFFAWVYRAYEQKFGAGVDVMKFIKAQLSPSLAAKLKQAEADYGQKIKWGGFNPRPMKSEGYRLGTLSDHSYGNAIDIDAKGNKQVQSAQWQQICQYTGIPCDEATRKLKWKTDPKGLHDTIAKLNDDFVKKVAADIATVMQANPTFSDTQAVAAVANANPPLEAKTILAYRRGFFRMPWSLVKELHDEGLLWGATFTTPDLHHFQM
jgi:hypothetical protein